MLGTHNDALRYSLSLLQILFKYSQTSLKRSTMGN